MAQVRHGCARTTASVRRAIQNSEERLIKLAKRYGINPKTVAKWRKRDAARDAKMGPKHPCSTVLTVEEEAACVAFRKHTFLPLDDGLYALQTSNPHLTRSSLHRLFQRHGGRQNQSTQITPRKSFSHTRLTIAKSTWPMCASK